MIDITRAKADAEEGLRIAKKATEGPWDVEHDIVSAVGRYSIGGFDETDDSLFAADARTRAPAAYRNVIALADENKRLRKEVERLSCDLGTCTDERNCLRLVLHEVWRRGVDLVGLPRYDPRKHGPTQELAFDAWVNDQ